MNKCLICEKTFKNLGTHVRYHNITGKEYYDKFIRTENEGICKLDNCNNETTFVNINEGYLKYCCHDHYSKCEEHRKNLIEQNKNLWKDGILGTDEHKSNMKKAAIKNWENQDSWHNSQECSEVPEQAQRQGDY